jgi:hypothetical protein
MSGIFGNGTFFTGCNYWASHAGTAMWQDWRPDIVDADFVRLSAAGIRVLRVFPLWPDFQPIRLLRAYAGNPVEYRIGEDALPDDEEGRAGMSPGALVKFDELTKMAAKHDIRLIVGLITGWMSGRLFVPAALEGLNALTDPRAILWEVRFVKCFVKRFKDCPAIAAWDLGNECNCMAEVSSAEQAWNWISAITNAIKSVDASRPVASGMHSLLPDKQWTIQDQSEVTDILTTHPYPHFTPYCDQDALNTMRTGLHAAAETLFYRGIGGKPCFVEETGTLGPMFASDTVGADFIRNNLFTLWAHNGMGMLWWCAHEQSTLRHAPYDWNPVERELGLFYRDGAPKPVLQEMSRFTEFIDSFPYGALPERIVDGICILTKGQDTWGAAYSAFVLAKQAGLDIEFRYSSQPVGDAGLYLLPSIRGDACISGSRMRELLEKVKEGAVLYISMDTGLLSPFSEFTGVRVITREKQSEADSVEIDSPAGKAVLTLKGEYKLILEAIGAEVIATDQGGNPAFTSARYGKGRVYFLNYPAETYLLDKPGVFHGKDMKPYWAIYSCLKKSLPQTKAVSKDSPFIGVTEHPLDERNRIIVAIHYEPKPASAMLTLAEGWEVASCLYGNMELADGSFGSIKLSLNQNDAVVFSIRKIG